MDNGKGFQEISEEMLLVLEQTHRFTKTKWTSVFNISYIGFGHRTNDDKMKITRKKAKEILRQDMKNLSQKISKDLGRQIPQQHFDVFCHIAYDFSIQALKNSSLYIRYKDNTLNNQEISLIMIWAKIKGEYSQAMLYRRQHDIRIFSSRDYKVDIK